MKVARNSIIGYSYQKLVAFYILALMDVEREILGIEIEADVEHKFDDLVIVNKDGTKTYCQMKDFKAIQISDITVSEGIAKIKSSPHSMADTGNIIFVKQIDIECKSEILGLPSYLIDNVYIISLSREEIREKVERLYEIDLPRMTLIESFFEKRFDERELVINLHDLPVLQIYSNQLVDPTIEVREFHIDKEKALFIEGKPGIGKSHLVNNIKVNGEKIIYRFWISNQDYDYQNRLLYDNFISDLIKGIFEKLVKKDIYEIISKLRINNITLILDGLDHVENYNPYELEKYIQFINSMEADGAKVIILSRPLKYTVNWEIYKLQNWNFDQTCHFLNEQYHLFDYTVCKEIYRITQGYPILVRFTADSYKINKTLPDLPQLDTINEYYDVITKKYSNKETLGLFLSSNSYFMMSELKILLGHFSIFIKQIIDEHPYLFEIKLNRISLLHDSLNTYLRLSLSGNTNVEQIIDEIKNKVYESIISGEKQFISRYLYFSFDENEKLGIIRKYADINFFENWFKGTIDIEAVQEFYTQLRFTLKNIVPNELTINNYYDISLIINILARDHITNLKEFLHIYIKSLIFNGYTEEDITSTGYLFGMLYFVKEGNYVSLEIVEANNHYDTSDFYLNIIDELESEDRYFDVFKNSFDFNKAQMLLHQSSELQFKDLIEKIFVALYINEIPKESEFELWRNKIHDYIDHKEDITTFVKRVFSDYGHREFFALSVMQSVKYQLKTLGLLEEENELLNLSLEEFIIHFKEEDSFQLISYIKDYLRLNLFLKKYIDVNSIYRLFTSYYARKDYTVNNIWKPLIVFQRKGYLKIKKSVGIIKEFQSKSEKGIRDILNDYVDNLNNQDFSYFIQEIYPKNEDLNLNIFQLAPEKINMLNSELVEREFFESLRIHSYSKSFEYYKLKNLLYSKYSKEVLCLLEKHQYKVLVQNGTFDIEDFKEYKGVFQITGKIDFDEKNHAVSNYEKGYLTQQDIQFIINENLSPIEIASLPDGFHDAFSELELYQHFNQEILLTNVHSILHAAICSKIYSIGMPSNLFEMLGNVPIFLDELDIASENFDEIFSSFSKFIEISGV
ncbi:hypothetical protein CSV71_05860 [Sporosarcina sp. P21c]|uniref:hypothetical protein n=1 Tax=unclassified Sporosarcina TaxID=2647733 RepID=UPI000C1683CD|nr:MULTISPECIES: hypothetical protein [unclassified Sporosarcina]PIC67280.1 hypothetical protein CSV78_08075 [Sporosarcina sp. P16a]PIC90224.1 hypothetical protein CSV71_05860 [Sporosarcina sp. P21c]PIC92732.1 hypothetical protein CSV70_08825 [Sporosarcina sp. P25]